MLKFVTPDLDAMEWSHPLPHHVGCVASLAITGSLGALPDMMGRGLTIP
jgi:hypothetical protein